MTEITITVYADENGKDVIIPDNQLAKAIEIIIKGRSLESQLVNTIKDKCKSFTDISVNVESRKYKTKIDPKH